MYVYYVSIELVTKQCKNWESIFIAMMIISIIDIKLINIDIRTPIAQKINTQRSYMNIILKIKIQPVF